MVQQPFPPALTCPLSQWGSGLASSPKCVMIGPLAGSGNQGDSRLEIVVRENAGVIHGGRETYVTKRSTYLGRN